MLFLKSLRRVSTDFLRLFFLLALLLVASCLAPEAAATQNSLPSPFGITLHLRGDNTAAIDQAMANAERLGFKMARCKVSWAEVEPRRGTFRFHWCDELVKSARSHGLDLMLTLSDSPAWAAGFPDQTPDVRLHMMPNHLKEWEKFVSVIVSRYKNDVRYWQIWERPSFDNFRGTSLDYFHLLLAAHSAAKKADPRAVILASEPGGPDLGFLAQLFQKPTRGAFEGVALSPQVDEPEMLVEYLDALERKILPVSEDHKLVFITDWRDPVGDAQAGFAVRAFIVALAGGVNGIFWDGQSLQARTAMALRVLSSNLNPSSRFELYRLDDTDVRLAAFQSQGGQSNGILWSAGNNESLSFPVPTKIFPIPYQVDQPSPINLARPVQVGGEPLLITDLENIPAGFRKTSEWLQPVSIPGPVCLRYTLKGEIENRLYTRKYHSWRGANPPITLQQNAPAAEMTTQENPFIYADVDDHYLFFNQGTSRIEVVVAASAGDPSQKAGFNLMYDSPRGYVFSRWVTVSPGTGWKNYIIDLDDANFANKGGFDFRVSDLGSDQDVYVSSICVQKL